MSYGICEYAGLKAPADTEYIINHTRCKNMIDNGE